MISKFRNRIRKLFTNKSASDKQLPPQKFHEKIMKPAPEEPVSTKPRKPRKRKKKAPAQNRKPQTVPAKKTELPEIREPEAAEGKTRFTDLDIRKEALAGIQDLEFEYCTPIQEMCLPHALAGKDICGRAQTGTGKTAAFLTAAISTMLRTPRKSDKPGHCRMLVLAPTRELAIQIHKDAENLSKYCGMNNRVVFGGMDHRKQREQLNCPIDILVGTPGRIIDYTRGGSLHFDQTEILVIDEADRMLDMGFIPDVTRIVSRLPGTGKRQTSLFSATLTEDIVRLSKRWLQEPVVVESEPEQLVAELIDQRFWTVSQKEKLGVLLWLLKTEEVSRMLIFVNRKSTARKLSWELEKYGVKCELLSGDVDQRKRLKILERFRSGQNRIIVATDVAARGIHVDNVSHVVNFELPERAEDYVHRIGRTGRAGESGKSFSLVCEEGAFFIPDLEKLLDKELHCELPTEEMVKLPHPPPLEHPPRRENYRPNRSKPRSRSGSRRRPRNSSR